MHDQTAEWVEKAETDFLVALRESQFTDSPVPDAVCFHAQQCIEKYSKAFLTEHDFEFPRTHSMEYLHEQCAAIDADFARYRSDFEALDDYSVDIRYPGDSAAEQDARDAVIVVERLRAFIRAKLGLDQPATPEGS
ncbi:MAG TPA: HEPN domain-containing protein [Anaerolineales bacterium]|nr:HEPN domain-containing protein [Anaerolineales bacterium]